MLVDLGLKPPDAAKLLHVSLRTLQNWLSGRHKVPYAVYKLLRMMRYMELPGQAWAGWHFSRGQLITPEGRSIAGHEGSWWSLLVRQSKGFTQLYGEVQRLRTVAARTEGPRDVGDAGRAANGLAGPESDCYAEPWLSENSASANLVKNSLPLGNHGDNKRITGPIWGQPDTILESWPLISDSLLPLIPSPVTTASGSESPSIASLASPLTLICDSLSRSGRWSLSSPCRLQLLPLRLLQTPQFAPSWRLCEKSLSLPLRLTSPHSLCRPPQTPGQSLAQTPQSASVLSLRPGISETGKEVRAGA